MTTPWDSCGKLGERELTVRRFIGSSPISPTHSWPESLVIDLGRSCTFTGAANTEVFRSEPGTALPQLITKCGR